MCRNKCSILSLLIIAFALKSYGQNSEIRIEVAGKADLTYDGLRIQVKSSNTLLGNRVAQEITSGLENTFLGNEAGLKNSKGSNNTVIGASAGTNNQGSGNIFIGYRAGYGEEGDEKLYIANSDTENPLIYGDFKNSLVEINDNLSVKADLLVEKETTLQSTLSVAGSTNVSDLNIAASIPRLSFSPPSQGSYQFSFHPSQDRFYLSDDNNEEVLEVKNGEIALPQYAGGSVSNLLVDEDGKLVKESLHRQTFNRYEFHRVESFTGYSKWTRGVQFADGTILSGIRALIKDNDDTGFGGVGDTAFVGIYRVNKFNGTSATISPIYRIDSDDTATGLHEEFTQTTIAISGSNVIDNQNYIYLIQVFICDDCDVSEVEILY